MGDLEYTPSPCVECPAPRQLSLAVPGSGLADDHSPGMVTPGEEKKNKSPSWYYSSMYPSYKTRRREFKSLFTGQTDHKKFVVDYSCAYHRDILHQGRLYVTTATACFYSYIFGWENKLVVKWSEVTAITKEKTAIFIPNAIQISTAENKFFFASFVDRDSSYQMLVRLWQAVTADQPLSEEDIAQVVACEYGEGDEDEADSAGTSEEEEEAAEAGTGVEADQGGIEQDGPRDAVAAWLASCGGTTVIDRTFPRPVRELFRLLYSNDNFYFNFQKERGTTELEIGDWEAGPGAGAGRGREVSYNMALYNPVGPKQCQVREVQTLVEDPAGKFFLVDTVAENSGVPYADSFSVLTHNCLVEAGDGSSSRLVARAEIPFTRDLWGFLKDKIETNAWSGIRGYYTALGAALDGYSESAPQRASRQQRRGRAGSRGRPGRLAQLRSLVWNLLTQPLLLYLLVLFLLATSATNVWVLYRLTSGGREVEPGQPGPPPGPARDLAEWQQLATSQAALHATRTARLRKLLLEATQKIAEAEARLDTARRELAGWEPLDWAGAAQQEREDHNVLSAREL